ncbi:hypothetical protein SR187_8610 [Streptococcus ruminantium]|uniref:Uncharacterized protein n=1 Tax=Streptococcus ruminantium TaxID=1917441 RepID=A0A2Z5TSR5_9STRE|nr:hypothetical protein SR187_8610 [Streptococcus ruminantium]
MIFTVDVVSSKKSENNLLKVGNKVIGVRVKQTPMRVDRAISNNISCLKQ